MKRLYSTAPPLGNLLPSSKFISRILFDLDSRLNYKKLFPVLQSVYLGKNELPNYIQPHDLMILQKMLKEIRTKTHTSRKQLTDLENSLVEKAAEMGDRDAVCILSFTALQDEGGFFSKDDKEHAKKLIAHLMEIEHPLAIKLSGDLLFKTKNPKAQEMYMRFLKKDRESFLAAEVLKALGLIEFSKPNLSGARRFFEKSINLAPLEKVLESHFYLGQIFSISDQDRARYHLEMAASHGLKESLPNLGFLELNYYNNPTKALEWFRLGWEIGDPYCLVGKYDCFMKLKDYTLAKSTLDVLKRVLNSESFKKSGDLSWEKFKSVRSKSIERLSGALTESKFLMV